MFLTIKVLWVETGRRWIEYISLLPAVMDDLSCPCENVFVTMQTGDEIKFRYGVLILNCQEKSTWIHDLPKVI